MVYILLYLAGAVILCVGAYSAYAAWRAYHETKAQQEKIRWATEQMERAIKQICSEDEGVILAGLQTLSMLNMPEVRIKALSRLTDLTRSPNDMIVKHAEANIVKVTSASRANP